MRYDTIAISEGVVCDFKGIVCNFKRYVQVCGDILDVCITFPDTPEELVL